MGFVRKVGSINLSFTFVLTHYPPDQRCDVTIGFVIEATRLAQRMFYVLAAGLIGSLGGMLTVWALHTSFALSCVYRHI